ncbi:NTP transferase domain-containing protein [Candidatus Woesearchaeota archaeon]|nr:NTP transferase domain-containing protein [Candidatus Woesearchaeota archaeon]
MAKVTKAIIAAAGLGSRMFPFTKVESKILIPIGNKPVIELLLEELTASGIKEVVIVSNHMHDIKQLFKDDKHLNSLLHRMKKDKLIDELHHVEYMADVDLISQDEPMGWMHEVFHAKEHLKDGPFLVCFSDVLYDSEVPAAKQVIDFFEKTNKNIKAVARFILKPDVFKMEDEIKFEIGEDVADEEIFEVLKNKGDFLYFNIDGDTYDVGSPLDYLKTQTVFGLKNKEIGKEYKKFLKNLMEKEEGK